MHKDMYADTYTLEERFWWFVGMRQIGRAFLDPVYADGPRLDVLDVGCGTGANMQKLLSRYGRVVGLDASAGMLAQARLKLAPFGRRTALVRQSAQDLPFGDATFSAVTCLEALEFLPDDRSALCQMVRVLQPGGVLLVTRRQGPEAAYFLGRAHGHDEFQALLAGLGLVEIHSQPWQVEYELFWAVRPRS